MRNANVRYVRPDPPATAILTIADVIKCFERNCLTSDDKHYLVLINIKDESTSIIRYRIVPLSYTLDKSSGLSAADKAKSVIGCMVVGCGWDGFSASSCLRPRRKRVHAHTCINMLRRGPDASKYQLHQRVKTLYRPRIYQGSN